MDRQAERRRERRARITLREAGRTLAPWLSRSAQGVATGPFLEEALEAARQLVAGERPDERIVDQGYRMDRWVVRAPAEGGLGIYLHRTQGADQAPLHDHPADNVTWLLEGEVHEESEDAAGTRRRYVHRPGDVLARAAADRHRLEVAGAHSTTLWLRGPMLRAWGFATEDGWVEAGRYRSARRNVRADAPQGERWQVRVARMVPEVVDVEVRAGGAASACRAALEQVEADDGAWLDATRASPGRSYVDEVTDAGGRPHPPEPGLGGLDAARMRRAVEVLRARMGRDPGAAEALLDVEGLLQRL